jgi:sugar phosphate isomerase/epimerase
MRHYFKGSECMKLGVFAVLYGDKTLESVLDIATSAGLQSIEIGTGGYVGKSHISPSDVLQNKNLISKIKQWVEDRGLSISALSCHGNPLHPNQTIAKEHHQDFQDTVRLAEALGVETVVTFSGCPGDSDQAQSPSWVTCPWPPDFMQVLEWQWSQKIIPYWKEQSEFCRAFGVRVAIEAHPGFVVYNTETALRLRQESGDNIGVNFDPSHLFWQGMHPEECIKALGSAIYHVHAKDTKLDARNVALNGVLDVKSYSDELHRSWIFRTVGYGNDMNVWKGIISTLRKVGYDGTISIEHEDSLMSTDEGFTKAARFLQEIIISERAGEMWWA